MLELTRTFEEVSGAGHDHEIVVSVHRGQSLAIQLEDDGVGTSHDQQGGCGNQAEGCVRGDRAGPRG